jgi:hypothetical protein
VFLGIFSLFFNKSLGPDPRTPAESIEAAISVAQACPFLDIGGSLEVSELVEMTNQET